MITFLYTEIIIMKLPKLDWSTKLWPKVEIGIWVKNICRVGNAVALKNDPEKN